MDIGVSASRREEAEAAVIAVRVKTCKQCGGGYTGSRYKYCSDDCAAKAHRKQKTAKQAEYDKRPGIAQTKSARDKAWRAANPDRVWGHSLRSNHDMTPEQWFAMLMEQGGNCYLCGKPLPDDRAKVAIDHDHGHCGPDRSCGKCRRGLAHHACNTGIGLFMDDPELLRVVADNLERVKEITAAVLLTAPVQETLFAGGELSAARS